MDYKTYEKLPVSGQYYAALGVIDALAGKIGSDFELPSIKIGHKFPIMQIVYPIVFLMKCEEYLRANWSEELYSDVTKHLNRILVDLVASIPEEGINHLDGAFLPTYYRALREARDELQEETNG